jgi:hypothetical protein
MASRTGGFARGLRNPFARRKPDVLVDSPSGGASASPLLAPLSPSHLVSHLHQRAKLYITRTSFILTALIANPSVEVGAGKDLFREEILEISYDGPTIRSLEHFDVVEDVKTYDVFGIVGLIQLHGGPRLILITQRGRCGKVDGHDVFGVENVAVLPLEEDRAILIMDQQSPNPGSFSPSPSAVTSLRNRSTDSTIAAQGMSASVMSEVETVTPEGGESPPPEGLVQGVKSVLFGHGSRSMSGTSIEGALGVDTLPDSGVAKGPTLTVDEVSVVLPCSVELLILIKSTLI